GLERQREQEAGGQLGAGLHDPELLQDVAELAVLALLGGLVPTVLLLIARLQARCVHGAQSGPWRGDVPHVRRRGPPRPRPRAARRATGRGAGAWSGGRRKRRQREP